MNAKTDAEIILTTLQAEALRIMRANGLDDAYGIMHLDCGVVIRVDVTEYDVTWMMADRWADRGEQLYEPATLDDAVNALANVLELAALAF